jgi:CDP-diacylglycerol--serine O-phosphatidyltransferase
MVVRKEKNKEKVNLKKGIFLLPNLFTTANLFAGCFSIFCSIDGKYELAIIAIIIAVFLDGLDGKIARAANAVSDFGKDYDSLCDLISFGVAPAVLFYSWITQNSILQIDIKFIWLLSFFFITTTALRLARFNNHLVLKSENYFIGLPSPASATLVSVSLWQCLIHSVNGLSGFIMMSILFISASILMVSKVKYNSFKDLRTLNRMPFNGALLIPLIFILIITDAPNVLSFLSITYLLSGPLIAIFGLFKGAISKQKENKIT